MTLPDLAESHRLLTTGKAGVRLERDVVRIAGPDAASWLQGQVSQDVLALAPGSSGWSFILAPQGKVDAWFRISRESEESYLIDLDVGYADLLVERLNRFKLRVKAEIEVLTMEMLALRVPEGASVNGLEALTERGAVLANSLFFGFGIDALGASVALPEGFVEVSEAAYELLRIEAGMPKMGSELNEDTIPAAAGVVDLSASFTKGCYTGQELVARVDSRGSNTPTHLRVLRSDGELAVGDVIGDAEGTITSAASHPDGGSVALGYVKRKVEVPCTVSVAGLDASVSAVPSAVDSDI